MARVKALTDRTIVERFAEIKSDEQLWGDIGTETRQLAHASWSRPWRTSYSSASKPTL